MVVLTNSTWLPSDSNTIVYDNYFKGYWIMFYYACLYLLGNDFLPLSLGEVIIAFFSVFIGSVTIGLLVA